ncbi:MAG: phosphoribosylaminoimidazolesuccinocarboxamide synthase [Candidatus Cloacimonetes bacterium]|nr:phosphoribosylaminoimidazolesuccinocarboxamide synthase [Candidatus Cloacimonadota bacterium]
MTDSLKNQVSSGDKIDKLFPSPPHYKGKVRDIYDFGDNLLIVTSDRLSAYDIVFPDEIQDKGKVLNQISSFFFKKTKHIIQNHFITDKIEEMPVELHQYRDILAGRCMLVKKTRAIPYECVCRGYVAGSAWEEYQKSGTIDGIEYNELNKKSGITSNLRQNQKSKETLFSPSIKVKKGHDEHITYKKMCERMDYKLAEKLKNISIELYNYANDFFLEKGIIIADTKFEFGTINGEIYLIDELFTPDSSRFWDKEHYEQGTSPLSYDKQFIRDYVLEIGWDKKEPAPNLPIEIIQKTIEKYGTLEKMIIESTQ